MENQHKNYESPDRKPGPMTETETHCRFFQAGADAFCRFLTAWRAPHQSSETLTCTSLDGTMIFFTFERGCRLRMPLGGNSGGTRSADPPLIRSLSWTGNVVGSGSTKKKIIFKPHVD